MLTTSVRQLAQEETSINILEDYSRPPEAYSCMY